MGTAQAGYVQKGPAGKVEEQVSELLSTFGSNQRYHGTELSSNRWFLTAVALANLVLEFLVFQEIPMQLSWEAY